MVVVVIGAGIAGLFVAGELAKSQRVLLLESRSNVGGRCRTRYTRDGTRVLYETGPWRLHENHVKLKRLLHDAGLETILSTPAKEEDEPELPATTGDLSSWDATAMEKGADAARSADILSGYEGFLDATNVVNVYHAQRHMAGQYFAIRTGFSSLVDALKRRALERGCEIRNKCRVIDVRKSKTAYRVACSDGRTVSATTVVCCLPPHFAKQWTVSQRWMLAQLNSIGSMQLAHVYAKSNAPPASKSITRGLLAQTVPGDFQNGWFQASYSAGRTALFWHRMAMRGELKRMVEKELGFNVADVKSHFWPHAVHFWKPAYGLETSVDTLVRRCIEPHPVQLPGMYWCGEAFSNTQGWVEGALETAEMTLRRIGDKSARIPRLPAGWKKTCVVVDGRVIDVRKFRKVHPGSEQAIVPFLGKDASTVFRNIGHSADAWAHLFSLQIGWKTT